MLIGGWGPGARAVVAGVAGRRRLELTGADGLALAAPPGALQPAAAGPWRVWLTGRLTGAPGTAPGDAGPAAAAAAFARSGEDAPAHLTGAYVLVALDAVRGTAVVCRDHLGARGLHHVTRGADVFFAEHVVDLLELLPATPAPDRLALVQFIDRRALPPGRSLYAGVGRPAPGHALILDGTGAAVRSYWRPRCAPSGASTRAESAERLRHAAFAAIDRAAGDLRAPAVKLSGGLDSACVAAGLAARAPAAGAAPLALAGVFPAHPESDESPFIEQTAHVSGLELVRVPYVASPVFGPVREYIRRWRLPPPSLNVWLWQPLMTAALVRGVDGVLDGEGGDELFGASPYLIADRLRTGRLHAAWTLAGRLPGLGADADLGLRLAVLRAFGISGVVPVAAQRWRRRRRPLRAGVGPFVLDADVPGLLAGVDPWAFKRAGGPLWRADAVWRLVNGPDGMDAGHLRRDAVDAGLDRRHPFLHDPLLLEGVLALPPEHMFDPARDRPLLRDALAGVIPESVRTRHAKSFFTALSTEALAGAEGRTLLEQLASPAAPVRAYVRPEALGELGAIATAVGPARDVIAGRLFCLAAVDCWLRELAG